ncbi:MAG: hypothetical protein ACOYL6_06280 [Bacteriovoracaceae bacterium]
MTKLFSISFAQSSNQPPKYLSSLNKEINLLKSFKDVHKQLTQSPYHLSYSQNHNFIENSKEELFKANFMIHDAFLTYQANKVDQFRLATRVSSYAQERQPTEHSFWYTEFRYRRSGILNQEVHGVSLSAENRQAYNIDEKRRISTGADGFSRTQLNFSKTFTPKFSLDFNVINFINYRNTSSRQNPQIPFRALYFNRLILSPSYVFNDKLTASLGIFYDSGHIDKENAESRGVAKSDDFVWIDPAINYVVNKWFNVDLDFGWGLYRSHDGREGIGRSGLYSRANNIHAWGYWYGLTFNFTVF